MRQGTGKKASYKKAKTLLYSNTSSGISITNAENKETVFWMKWAINSLTGGNPYQNYTSKSTKRVWSTVKI